MAEKQWLTFLFTEQGSTQGWKVVWVTLDGEDKASPEPRVEKDRRSRSEETAKVIRLLVLGGVGEDGPERWALSSTCIFNLLRSQGAIVNEVCWQQGREQGGRDANYSKTAAINHLGDFFSYFSLDIWINYQPNPFLKRLRKGTKTGKTSLPHSASTLTEESFHDPAAPWPPDHRGGDCCGFQGDQTRFFRARENSQEKSLADALKTSLEKCYQ